MRVLVILASFNGELYIKEQIDSILSQVEVEVYLSIYDDCSSDKTLETIEGYESNDNIHITRNSSPSGSAANNFLNAIQNLKNDYIQKFDFISFSDQDDIWFPNKLKRAIGRLMFDNASLYCSNLILWDEVKDSKSIINKSYSQKKYDYLFEGGSAGCTYVFNTNFCLNLKQKLTTINYSDWTYFSHDWFVYFFARINNYKVYIDNEAHILYRIHSTNVHGQLNKITLASVFKRLDIVKQGWYFYQIQGFTQLIKPNTIEKYIYTLYTKNRFSRLYLLLRYNFSLIRSPKKMVYFFFISILFSNKLKKNN